jgi:hypothetical protein
LHAITKVRAIFYGLSVFELSGDAIVSTFVLLEGAAVELGFGYGALIDSREN